MESVDNIVININIGSKVMTKMKKCEKRKNPKIQQKHYTDFFSFFKTAQKGKWK